MGLYVSIKECDEYFDLDFQFNTIWSAMSDTDKLRYIKYSMHQLDTKYNWCGTKQNIYDEYEFPRNYSDIYKVDDLNDPYFRWHGLIPIEIKQAVYILIIENYELNNKLTYYNTMTNKGINSFSDGIVSVTVDKGETPIDKRLFALVGKYTLLGFSMQRR
jgi:hypothetical protein